MPWYFRTLGSWVNPFRDCSYTIVDLIEPLHPAKQVTMSLVIIAESNDHQPTVQVQFCVDWKEPPNLGSSTRRNRPLSHCNGFPRSPSCNRPRSRRQLS